MLLANFNSLHEIYSLDFPPRIIVCKWRLRIAEHPSRQKQVANRVDKLAAATPDFVYGLLWSKILHHVIQSGMKLSFFPKCFRECLAVFVYLEPPCSVPTEHKQGPVRSLGMLSSQVFPHLKKRKSETSVTGSPATHYFGSWVRFEGLGSLAQIAQVKHFLRSHYWIIFKLCILVFRKLFYMH